MFKRDRRSVYELSQHDVGLHGRFGVLGAVAATLAITAVVITTVPFGRGAWDFVFILDGAYRISNGLTPHVDFSSPIGSLSFYVVAFLQRVLPGVHPFVGMHVAMWFLVMPVIAVLAPRFADGWRFLAATALASFIVLLPMTLDSTHLSEISYFASYNRFATAFLFLGGIWLVLPKRKHDWLLLTYILLVLFFLKITAAFVLCLILVAAVMLGRWSWVQGCLTLVGFGAGLLALQIATGLPLGYLDDVVMMSAVNQGRAIYAILFTGFRNWVPLAVTGVLAATALCALHRDRSLTLARPVHAVQVFLRDERFVVDTVLLVGAAWAAESQNTGGLGLFAALAALFHPDAWKRHRLTVGVLMAALLFPVMDIAVKRSITALSREKIAAPEQLLAHALSGNTRVPMSTFEGARLLERISHEWLPLAREVQTARFFLTPDPTSNAVAAQLAWFHGVVEAARAFEENGYRTRATRFTTIAFADPFARLLQVTPATGTNLVMDRGRTVPDYSPDQLRSYLENANGVFLERCDMTNDELETLFLPILQSEFDELPLTQCWSFFARTKGN